MIDPTHPVLDRAFAPAEPLASHADAEVFRADWHALRDVVAARGGCDAVVVDAPYSERTHAGHDDGAATANRAADYGRRMADSDDPSRRWQSTHALKGRGERSRLSYAAWTPEDVAAFVEAWLPLTRGWFVTLTDHVLAPAWEAALSAAGHYVFAPLACTEPGSRVRMTGDGPANWSCWAVVARPKSRAFASWGALPGAYVVPPGHATPRTDRTGVTGGKPLWLMESLVRDYTRAGDLVVDPCCGAGTTLVAAQRNGRRSIGGDAMREHAELAAKRISKPAQQPLFGGL